MQLRCKGGDDYASMWEPVNEPGVGVCEKLITVDEAKGERRHSLRRVLSLAANASLEVKAKERGCLNSEAYLLNNYRYEGAYMPKEKGLKKSSDGEEVMFNCGSGFASNDGVNHCAVASVEQFTNAKLGDFTEGKLICKCGGGDDGSAPFCNWKETDRSSDQCTRKKNDGSTESKGVC